jgi:hypothetical protein
MTDVSNPPEYANTQLGMVHPVSGTPCVPLSYFRLTAKIAKDAKTL